MAMPKRPCVFHNTTPPLSAVFEDSGQAKFEHRRLRRSIYLISSKPPQHLQSAAGIIRDMTQKMGIRVLFLHDSCAILIDIVIEDMEIHAKTPFQYSPTLSVIQRTYMPPPPPLNTIEISPATPSTPFLSVQCRVWGNTNFTLLAKVVD